MSFHIHHYMYKPPNLDPQERAKNNLNILKRKVATTLDTQSWAAINIWHAKIPVQKTVKLQNVTSNTNSTVYNPLKHLGLSHSCQGYAPAMGTPLPRVHHCCGYAPVKGIPLPRAHPCHGYTPATGTPALTRDVLLYAGRLTADPFAANCSCWS